MMNDTETIKKHLICSICSGVLGSPKTLPCFHTFCESCLNSHIRYIDPITSENTEYFYCAVCSKKTYPIDKSRKREQWAESFNTNSYISSILGAANLQNNDPKHIPIENENVIIGTKCTPCSFDDKFSSSFCFCMNCKEYLCEECNNDHKKFKLTCGHTAIRAYDYPQDISLLTEMSELGFCRLHSEKKKEFKCMDHDSFICCICAIALHKTCGSILHVGMIHETVDLECNDILKEMHNLNELIAKSFAQKIKYADNFETTSSRIEKQTDTLSNQLKSVLYHLEHEFTPKYKATTELAKRKLSASMVESVGLTELSQKYSSFADLVIKHGSKNHKMLLKQYLNVKKSNIIADLEHQDGSDADDVIKLVNNEMALLWRKLQEITNKGLEHLSTLKEIGHLETKTTNQASSTRNRSFEKRSIPSTIARQVTVEDTDHHSLLGDARGQLSTTKTGKHGINSHNTEAESDNDGLTLKDTYNNNSSNDAEKQCSVAETVNSSSVEKGENQCLLMKSANPVSHNAKHVSVNLPVNTSIVQDTFSHNSEKLNTNEVSVTDTTDCYSTKNADSQNVAEEKLTFSLLHCPIQKCAEYDISLPGKTLTTCSHNGVVCLENGDIIFIDKTNRIIKLLTAEFKYKTHQVILDRPLDIVLIGKDTVAVATSKAIVIYETSNSEIRRKNTFQTMDTLKSLCSIGEDLALLETDVHMTNPDSFIQIRSKQNRILKEIDNFTNSVGDKIYLDKPSLIRSRSDTELVVCEPDHMIVFGKSGRVKFEISTGYLRNIDNLIVDVHKNMYLCDTASGIIHMISGDSTRISRLLLSGIENPASIAFNPATNTLIIGCNCDNKAYVYRFQ